MASGWGGGGAGGEEEGGRPVMREVAGAWLECGDRLEEIVGRRPPELRGGGAGVRGGRLGETRGNPRVWRLGGLGPVWATLSQFSKHFLLQINLAVNFRKRRRLSR